MTRAVTFTQAQVRRAVKAAESAGLRDDFSRSGRPRPSNPSAEWEVSMSLYLANNLLSGYDNDRTWREQ